MLSISIIGLHYKLKQTPLFLVQPEAFAQAGQAGGLVYEPLVVRVVVRLLDHPVAVQVPGEAAHEFREGEGVVGVAVQVDGASGAVLREGCEGVGGVGHEGGGGCPVAAGADNAVLVVLCLELLGHVVAGGGGVDLPADAGDDGVGVGGADGVFGAGLVVAVVAVGLGRLGGVVGAAGLGAVDHGGAGVDEGDAGGVGVRGEGGGPGFGAQGEVQDALGVQGVQVGLGGGAVVGGGGVAVPAGDGVPLRLQGVGDVRGEGAGETGDEPGSGHGVQCRGVGGVLRVFCGGSGEVGASGVGGVAGGAFNDSTCGSLILRRFLYISGQSYSFQIRFL